MDRDKVIKGMEQFRSDIKPFCGGKADWERFDAGLALLKKQKWHVFHENEEGTLDVECIPNNGEEFLWYRKCSGDMCVSSWGDDEWSEYGMNADGEEFEDGDAWMELPEPPGQ